MTANEPVGGGGRLRDSARRIAALAWPVFIGQIAVIAFGTVDTLMAARVSAVDLAALAIGSSIYISVFIGLMGVVLAVGPIAGQLFGAGRHRDAGHEGEQAVWLALGLAALGSTLLFFPEPLLALAKPDAVVEAKVRAYLRGLALSLPPSLLFTAFRGFNVAVSRPKAVMALQLGGLALKIPVNAALVFGFALPTPLGEFGLQGLGAAGCGIATAIVMWLQTGAALLLLRRDRFYTPFGFASRLSPPSRRSLSALLRLGVPIGLSIVFETTGFTFMALFISRFGATPVAGHQIAVNIVAMMFMLPLALANATGTLVAQRIGARDNADARRLAWHGLAIAIALATLLAAVIVAGRRPLIALYTSDALVFAAAQPLLAWIAAFHIVDAAQTVAAFVLRAYRITTLPLGVYVVSVSGIGLGGGWLVAFDTTGATPPWTHGAQGFWAMATLGLSITAAGLVALMAHALRRDAARPISPVASAASSPPLASAAAPADAAPPAELSAPAARS